MPDAAFYLWARTPIPDPEFARRLYEDAGGLGAARKLSRARSARRQPGHEPRAHRARVARPRNAPRPRARIRDFRRTLQTMRDRRSDADKTDSMQDLQKVIDAAWEERAAITPAQRRQREVREAVRRDDRAARQRAAARRREDRRRVGHAPVGEESRAALVPAAGQRGARRRLHALLRQGAVEVRALRPRRRSRQAASASCRRPRCAAAPTSRRTSC